MARSWTIRAAASTCASFPGQYARFENAVTKGKNNMPPWGEVIPEDQIKALYAYVMAAEGRR